jgi:hypothetical protein
LLVAFRLVRWWRLRRAERAGRFALGLLGQPFLEHPLPPLADRGQRDFSEALRRPPEIAMVRPILDLPADTLPVLLEGVVPLDRRLQLEPHRRVADLFAPQNPEAAVDVLTEDQRLDPFDPHEILLVHGSEALDLVFELVDQHLDLA